MDLCAARGMVNIEIKAGAFEAGRLPDAIEEQVLTAVAERGMGDRVLISSFETRFLSRIADRANAPAVGVLTERRIGSDPLSLCKRLRAFSWHPDFRSVTSARVRAMHAAGIMVFPYTVNQPEDFRGLLQMGVDGVFTDDPLLLQAGIGRVAGKEALPP